MAKKVDNKQLIIDGPAKFLFIAVGVGPMQSFLKVATTLVDLLFLELMLYLSHGKQMVNQCVALIQRPCRQ